MTLVFILFIVGLFLAGYVKGRDSSALEIEQLEITVASLEAAQRISLRAWEAARVMSELARSTSSTRALPVRVVPNN